MEAGIRLLELAQNMHRLFGKQDAGEKRRLLNLVVSNSVWEDGEIIPVWRQPFDMIADANTNKEAGQPVEDNENNQNRNWLPEMDSNHRSRLQRPLSYR
jgi:hypothetical protein